MKILVCVKRVINAYAKVFPNSEQNGVQAHNLRYTVNAFDEIAIEEAVTIKESNGAEVIALGIGTAANQETLQKALAMGCDRAILVESDEDLVTLDIAKVISRVAQQEEVDLILMGKQSTDGDHSHTPSMVAGILDWSQATFASKIVIENDCATVTMEVDAGLLTEKIRLPGVISCDLRLNEPRYPSLPNIVKAKQKELKKIPLKEFNIQKNTNYQVTKYETPPERQQGEILTNVDELLEKLNLKEQ